MIGPGRGRGKTRSETSAGGRGPRGRPGRGTSVPCRTPHELPPPMALRPAIHIVLHLAVPGLVARLGWRRQTCRAWAVMVATMVVDLDHLLAEPLYDPSRCSLGFHPLHSWPALAVYGLMTCWRPTRLIGAGLVVHMVLDGIDCLWMSWET